MKIYIILTFIIVAFSCNSKKQESKSVSAVKKIDSNEIVHQAKELKTQEVKSEVRIDNSLIMPMAGNLEFEKRDVSFIPIEQIGYNLNGNDIVDSIKIQHSEGWEGDFIKINFSIDNEHSTTFKNFDAWMYVPPNFREYATNDYFIELNLGFKSPVLLFFGKIYASNPGYLSLYTFHEKEMKPIFNKEVWLNEIKTLDNGINQIIVNQQGNEYQLVVENNEFKLKPLV